MPTGGTRMSTTALVAALAVLALALPSVAAAAGPAAVTISACKDDRMTVDARLSVGGANARKVRGATLETRFQAMPLFGIPRAQPWKAVGRKRSFSGRQEFTGLGADSWAGVLSWRFKRGRRTVLSGDTRSEPVRVGRVRGRANCILTEGLKPVDATPPTLYILPSDQNWHRAPAPVQLLAQDDFSGVQRVVYSLDGGPATEFRNGQSFAIPTEGAHTVQWSATDVAGNTASRTDVVRVDAAPPSKPTLQRPFSVTASTTPTFTWSASSDTGSGLKGYFLAIKRADGSLVALKPVDANTTSTAAPVTLNDGETYTAVVTAVDNTDTPWASESDPLTFRVDTNPSIDSSSPADNSVLKFNAGSDLTITLDRSADSSTVTGSTVVLTRDGSPVAASVSCTSECRTIVVNPDATLAPGRYAISIDGVRSQEGGAFSGGPVNFAVPSYEEPSLSTSNACLIPATDPPFQVTTTAGGETIVGRFDYSTGSATGRVRILEGGNPVPGSEVAFSGSGSRDLSFTLTTASTHTLVFEYCRESGSGAINLSNVWVSRSP